MNLPQNLTLKSSPKLLVTYVETEVYSAAWISGECHTE